MGIGSLDRRISMYWFIAFLFVLLVGLGISAPRALAASDVGYRDHSFAANSVTNPTGEKPQSKLWFNDGIWWASMFNKSTEEFHIYRYDRAANTWSDTGTLIDERNSSKADTLWDGTHLYVATSGPQASNTNHGARILRFTYDPATKRYTRDAGFPVSITPGGLETIVLDKDTTGRLWVTYAQNSTYSDDGNIARQVYVNRTLSDDRTWGTPFALPVKGAGNLTSDDISAVVAFDSQIGVMWSNQIDDAMYFATHKDGDPDGVWQSSRTAIQGPKYADDHISLRSLQATDSSGRVFAAVKTSLNDLQNPNPNAPLTLLLARDKDGNWTNYTFGRVADNHTRPVLMLDEEHRDLYMFATSPCCNGGAIYYKKTNLNNISFSDGLGEPFIKSATDININDATSTKQNVSSATGLMVMASSGINGYAPGTGYYWHNYISLAPSDTTAPETSVDSGPSGTVLQNSATLAFSSSEANSTFECSLDGGGFASCTSPKSYAGLSDGPHTFSVRATDAAGNTDASPASRTWTIDTTAPDTTITSGPSGSSNSASASFGFSSSETGSTFECSLDGAAYATCTPPQDYANLSEGSHSFSVKATDAAGNTGAPASRAWTVNTDGTAPTTTASAKNADNTIYNSGDWTRQNVTVTLSASDDTGVQSITYSASGAQQIAQTTQQGNSVTLPVITAEGTTTITYRATDNSGNVEADKSFTLKIDKTAPNAPTVSSPADNSYDTDGGVTLSGTAEVGSTVELFDGTASKGTVQTDGSGNWSKALTGVADGPHTYTTEATDAAGNVSAASNSRTVNVDTQAPSVAITSGPAPGSTVNSPLVSFDFSSNETGATFECQLDGGNFVGCISPQSYSDLANSPHTFTVRATDAAGNSSTATRNWTVKTGAPETTIDAKPASSSNNVSPSFSFSSSEQGSTFECKLDAGSFATCTSPKSYTNLPEGSHTFQVRATDTAGNTDASPATYTWAVDTTAPTVVGLTPASGATNVAVGTSVEATFSEGMDQSTLSQGTFTLLKQGTTTPLTATVNYDTQAKKAILKPGTALAEGSTYTATLKGGTSGVKDTAGNPLQTDKTWSFSTTAVMAPSNLSATRVGNSAKQRVDLSWVDNSKVEAKFVIERSTASNFTSNLVTYEAPANATSFGDTGILSNKQYFYRVFAVNSSGTRSAASNVVTVTTGK